jgi:hypothetical protein
LRNREYCHFHLDQIGRQLRAARARARHQPARLKLPLLEDPFAVQVALMQVADAIAYNEIDALRGRLLMSVLRLASSNLKTARAWKQEPLFVAGEDKESALTEWPGFEQENQLPPDFDLRADPEAAFPPPLPPAEPQTEAPLSAKLRQALADAETTIPGTRFVVTGEDMELMEIYEREGDHAALKFASEMERNRKRRERRLQRAHYEELARNRNIQLAAEKLACDQARLAQAAQAGIASPGQDEADPASRKLPQSEATRKPRKAVSGTP